MKPSDNVLIINRSTDLELCEKDEQGKVAIEIPEVVVKPTIDTCRCAGFCGYACRALQGCRDAYNDMSKSTTFIMLSSIYAYFTSYISYSSIYTSNWVLYLLLTVLMANTASAKLGSLFIILTKQCRTHRFRHEDTDVMLKIKLQAMSFVLNIFELITIGGVVESILQHDTYHTIIYSISLGLNVISIVGVLWTLRQGNKTPIIGVYYLCMGFSAVLLIPALILYQFLIPLVLMAYGPRRMRDIIFPLFETLMSPYLYWEKPIQALVKETEPYFLGRGKRCYEKFYWY